MQVKNGNVFFINKNEKHSIKSFYAKKIFKNFNSKIIYKPFKIPRKNQFITNFDKTPQFYNNQRHIS